MMEYNAGNETEESMEPSESATRLAKELCAKVKDAKKFHEKAFKRMREDMEVVRTGTSERLFRNGKKYVANIAQRHVAQRVSALYAKNPTAIAERRKRRNFQIWDENPQSIMQAMQ